VKKIISLYQRNYDTDRLVRNEVVPGAKWVLAGEGIATRKFDGTCCMVRDGKLYKRYDAKKGKTPPVGFEPAQDYDLHCVSCLCVVQYPKRGANYATQGRGSEKEISQRLLSETSDGRLNLPPEGESKPQQSLRVDLRAVRDDVQGPQREAVLHQRLRGEMAMEEWRQREQWKETGKNFEARGEKEIIQQEGLCSGVPTQASQTRPEWIRSGTSASDGKEAGEIFGTLGDSASQKQRQGGQSTTKPTSSDARNASWISYLSTLPEGISTALTCPHCGSNQTTQYVIPDPVTGHMPGWLLVDDRPEDKYHIEAWANRNWIHGMRTPDAIDGTYELCGPKVNGNPERFDRHVLVLHGYERLPDAPREFFALKRYFEEHNFEGIVWHHADGRMVKIKARDFGIDRR